MSSTLCSMGSTPLVTCAPAWQSGKISKLLQNHKNYLVVNTGKSRTKGKDIEGLIRGRRANSITGSFVGK